MSFIDKNIKILIVDDLAAQRALMLDHLNSYDFKNIVEAENGHEAYNKVIEHYSMNEPFQFIFTDINMPVMSGIELLRKIRSHPVKEINSLPIIILSTENEQSLVFEAIALRASDYIIKPYLREKFFQKFYTLLALNKTKQA
jgi:two-component system, chemotaxis family, chemotaxis protein CheY